MTPGRSDPSAGPSDAPPLVLASASPRRAAVLDALRLPHVRDAAGIPEEWSPGESPAGHAERLAVEKAREVAGRHPEALVVAGDTVVVHRGELLGKPADGEEALAMLLALRDSAHTVITGVAVVAPGGTLASGRSRTRVSFRAFDEATARAYLSTGEPLDKAGAYGIQGLGAALVARIEGEYHTVVGLPVTLLVDLLEESGWRYRFGTLERRPAG